MSTETITGALRWVDCPNKAQHYVSGLDNCPVCRGWGQVMEMSTTVKEDA